MQRNVLYFTPGPADGEPGPVDLTKPLPVPDPLPPLPGSRITCLAANVSPLQGWSFGVSSDPKFIQPKSIDIEGTSTKALHGGAGPEFIHLEILDGGTGVVMAVVVGGDETLPPGQGHRLLNVEYEPGPSGMAGEAYSVRYTDTLGSPPVQVIFVVDGFEVAPHTIPGWVSVPGPRFLRGDSNGDGRVDVSDGRFTLDYLFLGGREPDCLEASNANGSTRLNLADVIYTLQALFGGGPPPPAPFPLCGTGPTPLGCKAPGPCVDAIHD
ncbi:MAG TPA: hypothetical protein VMT52_17980 [Planctomycetota bacterium]|nr:hypothetical protein [Planctomycetota bacterium]